MTRIFLSLSLIGLVALLATFALGWHIGNATSPDAATQGRVAVHFLAGVAAVCFGVFLHALVLTYFMGTGRWLEETCTAYRLGNDWQRESRDLKWGLYPTMIVAVGLLIVAGASGAAADPASGFGFTGLGPLSAPQVHLTVTLATLVVNLGSFALEWRALARNGTLVHGVLAQVRQIRVAKGLAV
ncbi:MAG: hypothetical protein ACT4QC_12150 [Planctomycetaceae bacterium]